jgi:hypothetical protein
MRKCPHCAEWVAIDSERCKYCDRTLIATSAPHAAPFIDTSSSADDLAQALRQSLLDDDSEEAAAIAAAAAEFIAEDPEAPIAGVEDEASEDPVAAFSDLGMAASIYDEPQSELRRSLYDGPQDEAARSEDRAFDEPQSDLGGSLSDEPEEGSMYEGLSDEVETPLADESPFEPRGSLYDEPFEGPLYDTPTDDEQASIYDEPQSDLRRSLYDEPLDDEVAAKSSTYYEQGDEGTEYIEPVGAGSGTSIWLAGAEADDNSYQGGTGPLTAGTGEFGRSVAGTEGVSELRADVSGPPGRIRRNAGKIAKAVIILAVIGAASAGLFVSLFGADGWGVFALSEGPLGAIISDALATEIPTKTPIPEPTATRRPAPTLPPEVTPTGEGSSVLLPPGDGTPSSAPGCVSWETITVEDEGSEACVYGVIKRWWAGDEIPFISIFSEEEGTFSIIDRTGRHPVGPGSCIMARGTVEIMGGVRPNIDAQGVLEDCPEGVVDG